MPRKLLGWIVQHGLVLAVLLWCLFPIFYAFTISIKTTKEFYMAPFRLIPKNPTLMPYKYILTISPYFPRQMLNSVVVALGSVALTVVMACIGGYAYARLDWRFRDVAFYAIIVSMFIPRAGALMAQYELMDFLGLRNSLFGLILAFGAGLPVPLFVMRQNFLKIPREIEESAYIDGANTWQVLWRIALPMASSGMLVVAILKFVQVWGNYLFVLTMLDRQEKFLVSISIAIIQTLAGDEMLDYQELIGQNVSAAAYMAVMFPVVLVYLLLQKWFVRGLREGVLKA
jgi:ABC-type glycerol-3-phosphate transport system permease component